MLKVHPSLSVEAILKTYTPIQWRALAKHNNISVDEMKEFLYSMYMRGDKFVPYGRPCNRFDPKTGCQGHDED